LEIIIIGAGEVGFNLAARLSQEKHDLVIIDSDKEKCNKIEEILDISVIHGNGSSQSILKEAGVESADMLIAATTVDEVNLLACMIASRMGVRRKIARVRNPEYYSSSSVLTMKDLGVDLLIHPEEEVAEEITRLLMRSIASEIVEFEEGKILMVGIKIDADSPILNIQLKNLGTPEQRKNFRIVAISKGNKTIIPDGNEYINKNDQVFVVTKRESLNELLAMTGKQDKKLEKIMILGGGKIGRNLARNLEENDIEVSLLEANKEKSIEIASTLKKSMVFNVDGTEIDLLAREGILNMDALIAVTSDDETNIIACLLAKHIGVKKAIALVNKMAYLPLMPVIGIDATVNVRLSTANAILRFIRRGDILSVATFHGIDAEAIELKVSREGAYTGKMLKNMKLPEGALVAAIIRGESIIIPYGDSIIEPNDRIIVFALPHAIHEIEDKFSI